MSLILAPQAPGMVGVSMAPIVMDIKLGLEHAMKAIDKATSSKPRPATRKAKTIG